MFVVENGEMHDKTMSCFGVMQDGVHEVSGINDVGLMPFL